MRIVIFVFSGILTSVTTNSADILLSFESVNESLSIDICSSSFLLHSQIDDLVLPIP